jgi:hypothetical protein
VLRRRHRRRRRRHTRASLSSPPRRSKVIVTPTTKDDVHDRPISAAEVVSEGWMTADAWAACEAAALALFAFGSAEARARGLILVDTKYEFGADPAAGGAVTLIDEVHTPDSSRYWLADTYEARLAAGAEPDNIDKEFLRIWFREHCDPYGDAPLPAAPPALVAELSRRYVMLAEKITGEPFALPPPRAPGALPAELAAAAAAAGFPRARARALVVTARAAGDAAQAAAAAAADAAAAAAAAAAALVGAVAVEEYVLDASPAAAAKTLRELAPAVAAEAAAGLPTAVLVVAPAGAAGDAVVAAVAAAFAPLPTLAVGGAADDARVRRVADAPAAVAALREMLA